MILTGSYKSWACYSSRSHTAGLGVLLVDPRKLGQLMRCGSAVTLRAPEELLEACVNIVTYLIEN